MKFIQISSCLMLRTDEVVNYGCLDTIKAYDKYLTNFEQLVPSKTFKLTRFLRG